MWVRSIHTVCVCPVEWKPRFMREANTSQSARRHQIWASAHSSRLRQRSAGGRSCRWASTRRFVQIFSGYSNQSLEQHLSGWQLWWIIVHSAAQEKWGLKQKCCMYIFALCINHPIIYYAFEILYPYYKLAALQKCDRTAHFKCFTLFGGSEISSVFNSVSCSRLRNFTVVTESYLAFYTGHQSRRFILSRTLCRKWVYVGQLYFMDEWRSEGSKCKCVCWEGGTGKSNQAKATLIQQIISSFTVLFD